MRAVKFNLSIIATAPSHRSLIFPPHIQHNYAFKHQLSTKDETVSLPQPMLYIYNAVTESQYHFIEFKGLLINSGAVARSTDKIDQFKAFQGVDDSVHFDVNIVESFNFTFDIDNKILLESVNLITSSRLIIFHIVSINISFLLCLTDMNRLKVFFNNIINQLIQSNQTYFVICKYSHAFLKWHIFTYFFVFESLNVNSCNLTEIEFCCLHRHFDHFFIRYLEMILDRVDHDFDTCVFCYLIKYCDQCQKHDCAFDWFSFIIKNDVDFNFNVIVKILYITSKSVLHVIDKTICFQRN